MPKFKFIQHADNKALVSQTKQRVEKYLHDILNEGELMTIEGFYAFKFGTVMVQVRVLPWHADDVLVEVFSYLADHVPYNPDLAKRLLRLNSAIHFGAFGVTYNDSVVFTYSLAGANLDFNEFLAAVQTVATVSDHHDELVKEFSEKAATPKVKPIKTTKPVKPAAKKSAKPAKAKPDKKKTVKGKKAKKDKKKKKR
jgi:hypothetical protein